MAARQVGDAPRLYDTHKAAVSELNIGARISIGQAMYAPCSQPFTTHRRATSARRNAQSRWTQGNWAAGCCPM